MTEVLGDGDKGTGEHVFTDLSKYTRYLVVVQAYNSIGQGPLSEPVNTLTLEDGNKYHFLLSVHELIACFFLWRNGQCIVEELKRL